MLSLCPPQKVLITPLFLKFGVVTINWLGNTFCKVKVSENCLLKEIFESKEMSGVLTLRPPNLVLVTPLELKFGVVTQN